MTTPGADELMLSPEATPMGQQVGGVTPMTDGPAENVEPSPTASDPATANHLPQLPQRADGEISYENQGRLLFSNYKYSMTYSFKVLPTNWLMKGGLATKCIWAHVRNTETNPFEGGFARGRYEGQRVLVMCNNLEVVMWFLLYSHLELH